MPGREFYSTAFASLILLVVMAGVAVGQVTTNENLVGTWSGENLLPGTRIEIAYSDDVPTLFMYFADGSVLESNLVEKKEPGGRRFIQIDDPTEWYVLNDDGYLDAVNERGVFNTFPPLSSPQ